MSAHRPARCAPGNSVASQVCLSWRSVKALAPLPQDERSAIDHLTQQGHVRQRTDSETRCFYTHTCDSFYSDFAGIAWCRCVVRLRGAIRPTSAITKRLVAC